MAQEVIAVYDIGKTNKKLLLFNKELELVFEEEQVFDELTDEDGFACDDIGKIETWMKTSLDRLFANDHFLVKAANITTYGASLVYLDGSGERLTPVYNYLKPMPEGVLNGFYETCGGMDEFSRKTASPAMGMLNSGLQILWLKKTRPGVFSKVKHILHLPQYLACCLTGKITTEYTSIGCHTAMWDFDQHRYHQWVTNEGISLPEPVANDTLFETVGGINKTMCGIGIHDSSSSLVPYLKGDDQEFILLSTGTWGIFMNPFNDEMLTAEQLKRDTLCYMSVKQSQVKSSRLFMGYMHEVNARRLTDHFGVVPDSYKEVKANRAVLSKLEERFNGKRLFFAGGVPETFVDELTDLHLFDTFEEAYHQLMKDITSLAMDSVKLVISRKDKTSGIYISGGFARNDLFVSLMAKYMPEKKVYTSEIDNSTALGAAMVIYEKVFRHPLPATDLGLKAVRFEP